jgi:hypothetical protein
MYTQGCSLEVRLKYVVRNISKKICKPEKVSASSQEFLGEEVIQQLAKKSSSESVSHLVKHSPNEAVSGWSCSHSIKQ